MNSFAFVCVDTKEAAENAIQEVYLLSCLYFLSKVGSINSLELFE